MKWDWYSATVDSPPEQVLGALQAGQPMSSVYPGRGLHSYTHGAELRRGDVLLAKCMWGGVNGDARTHVQCSGSYTPQMVQLLRQEWPAPLHRVSRADSCEDWSGDGLWGRLKRHAMAVSRAHNVVARPAGDWFRPGGPQGRSLYLGAESSRVWVNLYEKGKQLGVDPNWVRLEVRVKPSGEGKLAMAEAVPGQLMESAQWTAELARRVGIPELDELKIRDPWTKSDDDRALAWMCKQYGNMLVRKSEEWGSWCQLGVHIGELVTGLCADCAESEQKR